MFSAGAPGCAERPPVMQYRQSWEGPNTTELFKKWKKTRSISSAPASHAKTPSAAGAIAAFKEQPYLKNALAKTIASKEFLYKVLKEEGYEYIPSHTNFVMFPIKMEGKKFTDEMMKRGVGVRFWKFNNKEWCRVSIGRMDEMEAFKEAFKEIS